MPRAFDGIRGCTACLVLALLAVACRGVEAQWVLDVPRGLGFGKVDVVLGTSVGDRLLDHRYSPFGRIEVGLPGTISIFAEGVVSEDPLVGAGGSVRVWGRSALRVRAFARVLVPLGGGDGQYPGRLISAAAIAGAGFATVDVWAGVTFSRRAHEDLAGLVAGARIGAPFMPFAVVTEAGIGNDKKLAAAVSFRF